MAAIGRIHCGIDVDNRRDALVFVSRRYSIAKVILRDNHGRTMITRWVDVGRLGYTTSRLEGCNQKIKTLKRSAYGFNDMDYFFLKIKSILPESVLSVSMTDLLAPQSSKTDYGEALGQLQILVVFTLNFKEPVHL